MVCLVYRERYLPRSQKLLGLPRAQALRSRYGHTSIRLGTSLRSLGRMGSLLTLRTETSPKMAFHMSFWTTIQATTTTQARRPCRPASPRRRSGIAGSLREPLACGQTVANGACALQTSPSRPPRTTSQRLLLPKGSLRTGNLRSHPPVGRMALPANGRSANVPADGPAGQHSSPRGIAHPRTPHATPIPPSAS